MWVDRLWCLGLLAFGCSAPAADLRVAAASSLSDALGAVVEQYTSETGESVRTQFAASGTLARQIEQGARVDLFLSADEAVMQRLIERGLVAEGSAVPLLSNHLVLAVPSGNPARVTSWEDLKSASVKRVAIGVPDVVPAGTYAREALTLLGCWEPVLKKAIQFPSVRAVLRAVESGSVDAGVVYSSDVIGSNQAEVVAMAPEQIEVVYPAAVLVESGQPGAARRFLQYLSSESARAVFRKYGFPTPASP